ncbi:MAG: hypothetical protein KY455_06635 [Euryarchaeota archaeon]|nr:hypothetical protein [Euryarchaeota archaeon]
MSQVSPARVPVLVLAILALALGGLATNATAQNPVYGLDDRVFPEPMMSTSFLQFPDFVAGIEALDAAYPQYMDVRIIGESLGGLPIYFVELTNEASDKSREEKLQIGYSASIHANEAAGREGMVRVIEDLVSGTGPLGALQPALDDVIINIWFPNPDSWASGDWFGVDAQKIAALHAPTFSRGNMIGVDLNREFPNPGWILESHTPMSEPESRSVVKELRYSGRHDNLVAGTDLHGMINSPNMMRAIIPNQDMDFHRMMVTIRFLNDLEDRVNTNEHFAEWNALAESLCMVPEPSAEEEAHGDHHTHDAFSGLPEAIQEQIRAIDDGDGVWSLVEAEAAAKAAGCERSTGGPTGGVGHGQPFLWGARWDQIGYTDSGFTSDYLMLSPRSPTGGMGAVGTITEFAYSHMVPNNNYVAKLTDMHVAGVRETVRAQVEYTLLTEQPKLDAIGPTAYVVSGERVTSKDTPTRYEAEHGKDFSLDDEETYFDFNQVDYDVQNTDFWRDLAKYSTDPVEPLQAAALTAATLAPYDNLVITDAMVDLVDAAVVRAWVETGGNLILTDQALTWFDAAGLTTGAAFKDEHYLGHSDLIDGRDHPLLAGVDWNARQTGEGPPTGHAISEETTNGKSRVHEYPQWHLKADKVSSLDLHVAGMTHGDPSLGTAKVGDGTVHFIGAALPEPKQHRDHRYGLAPYAVTALTYYVFVNALGGVVEWKETGAPFIPFYPDDPLYGARTDTAEVQPADEGDVPAPGLVGVLATLALLGAALQRVRRRA